MDIDLFGHNRSGSHPLAPSLNTGGTGAKYVVSGSLSQTIALLGIQERERAGVRSRSTLSDRNNPNMGQSGDTVPSLSLQRIWVYS
jgi:hypothetical protein